MDWPILAVFVLVYAGLVLGRLPGLALDRTGIALLGAIALIAFGSIEVHAAWDAIDVGTIALLFGMMVVSAQLERGGFYERVAARIATADVSPAMLAGLVVAVVGVLSAVLTNDVVCLALAPLLVEATSRRGLAPLPYLLALAAAANVGSAATLIGNPQNMLIGQRLGLDFRDYLADAAVPAALGLLATWGIVCALHRGRWHATATRAAAVEHRPYDAWAVRKGLAVVVVVVALFLVLDTGREVVALGAAGVILASRRSRSREILAVVDWQLLVLFAGLFVVNRAFEASGMLAGLVDGARARGVDPSDPPVLFGASVALSNLVSSVPAVMLLLPVAVRDHAGALLAVSSTLAGNLLLVGSIANLIVADQAGRHGVRIGWREHARVGVPVTIATLAIAAAWFALRA